MSDIRDQLARMTPEERAALLAEVRQKRHVDAGSVQRRKSNAPIPLSSAQERLWIVEKLDPDHVNQNIAGVMMVEGDLNVNRLRHAMLSVQKRHEILRTAIQVRDDEPKQVVLAEPVLDYKYVDLHEGKPAGSEEANGNLNVLLRDMAVRKFDMASGCMLRMCVVRTGERSHSILVSMHHMVGDGGSISLMIHELWAAYLDRSSELPKPAVQYGDYAIWQRQQLGRDPEGKAMSWWRQVLDGMSHRLQLEPCRKRPAVLTATSSRRSMEIPPDVAAAVQKVAAAMEVTPFHVYIAAYAVVLMRFGAGDDFAIGVPVSLRTRPELQPLVGCFLNMLPVRMDMRDSPSFGEVVRRARQHMLAGRQQHLRLIAAARHHQRLPLTVAHLGRPAARLARQHHRRRCTVHRHGQREARLPAVDDHGQMLGPHAGAAACLIMPAGAGQHLVPLHRPGHPFLQLARQAVGAGGDGGRGGGLRTGGGR